MTLPGSVKGSLTQQDPHIQRRGVDVFPNAGITTADEMDDETEDLQQVAQALIINDEGKVLGVSRGHGSDEFTPPGGLVEKDEEPIDAAARELKEETGLNVTTIFPLFAKENEGRFVSVFLCRASGKIQPSDEGDVEWIAPEKLTTGMFSEYYSELFRSIGLEVA